MLKFLHGYQVFFGHGTWWPPPPTPKFLHSDFCLYIFEGLFLKKEKCDGLILLKLKTTKRHVFSLQCFGKRSPHQTDF